MLYDGVEMTKFFKWIEEHVAIDSLSELSIIGQLLYLRKQQPDFKDISYETIAGYKGHGALPHY